VHALLSIPVPFMPNAFLFQITVSGILVAFLALVAFSQSFRRYQFALFLIPAGILEFLIVSYYSYYEYYVPTFTFILSFVTVTSGIMVPILYAMRRLLSRAIVRILLFLSGLVELSIGVNTLFYYFRWYVPSDFDLFVYTSLATVGIYSMVVSVFLNLAKRNNG
jgi:hypothetical protein